MNVKQPIAKEHLQGTPDHFEYQKPKSSSFLCCGGDSSQRDLETSIWLRDRKLKPLPKYKQYQGPRERPALESPHRGNWSSSQVASFKTPDPSEEAASGKQQELYKWISMKYDMERDNRLAEAEEQMFPNGDRLRPEEKVKLAEFQEMKLRIEWDVAWRIFDHVNENNDTSRHIDLHCLDLPEAESITKQQIYECARLAQNDGQQNSIFSMNLLCLSTPRPSFVERVLSVRCSAQHVEGGKNRILEMLQNDFDYLDYFYLEELRLILVRIDSGTIKYNKVMREW